MKNRHVFFLHIFLVIILLFSVLYSPLYAINGSGLASDPFIINNLADLQEVAELSDNTDVYVKLNSDLDLSGFTPISDFKGIFDGQGFEVSGGSLFNDLNNASVSNVSLVNAKLASNSNGSTISSVSVFGNNLVDNLNGGSVSSCLISKGQIASGGSGASISNSLITGQLNAYNGNISNVFFDKVLNSTEIQGYIGLSTNELISKSISGLTNTSTGYPYPSVLNNVPFASFALKLDNNDTFDKVTENINLPTQWQGQSISWSLNGTPVSNVTDFSFSINSKQNVTLTASVNGKTKYFNLTLDRVLKIKAVNFDGSKYSSGGKTNQKVTVKATGHSNIEYSLDNGNSYSSFLNDLEFEESVDLLFRYAGGNQTISFVIDYLNEAVIIDDFIDGYSGYLGFVFNHNGTYTVDQGSKKTITKGTLIKEPGEYIMSAKDDYGNTASAGYEILKVPLDSESFDEVEIAIINLQDELFAAHSAQILPIDYLQEMDDKYFALKKRKNLLIMREFDEQIMAADTDEKVELLYWKYHSYSEEQKALIENIDKYHELITSLRNKRLYNEEHNIKLVPLEDLPIDVYLHVEKSKNGFILSLMRNGEPYYTNIPFIVYMPYNPDRKIYFNGQEMSFRIEGDYAVFEVEGLGNGETDYKIADITALNKEKSSGQKNGAINKKASQDKGSLSPAALGGTVLGLISIAAFLFHTKKVDTND